MKSTKNFHEMALQEASARIRYTVMQFEPTEPGRLRQDFRHISNCDDQRHQRGVLTVETEVNGVSMSTKVKGPSLVVSLDLSCRYKRLLPWLLYCSLPSTKFLFSHRILFQCLCPHLPASWVGSPAGSPVSYSMCLW
jgi:hypothetical protein